MGVVYTSRVGYCGQFGLDITVKSAKGIGEILAPTWELVGGYKRWQGYTPLTEQQYIETYLNLLRSRYRTHESAFIDFIHHEHLVLLCYCRTGVFCHRHVAVDILERIAHSKGLPFTRGGELPINHLF